MVGRLPDLEAWAIFAKVAEQGSFSQAAKALGLSDPTVSKAIARLEARLGFALVARTSRRVSLTDAGRAAVARAARILSEGEAVETETAEQASAPRGLVRVAAPLSFGIAYLGSVMPGFLGAYPEIRVEFALSDRKVDLVGERFDLALRIARLDDSSLLSRRICAVRLLLVGAPGYFAVHGSLSHPAELGRHSVFAYTGGPSRGTWRFTHARFGDETASPAVRIWTDNADVLMPALLAGQGIAIQPEFLVWRDVRDGRLVHAMPDWTVTPLGLYLMMPPSPLRPLRVQVLIDYLARELAEAPWAARIAAAGAKDVSSGPRRL